MDVYTEGRHPGECIIAEEEANYCREVVTVPAGTGIVGPDTVLGKITADGNYVPSDGAAADGSEKACAVVHLRMRRDRRGSAKVVAIVRGPATLNRNCLTYAAARDDGRQEGGGHRRPRRRRHHLPLTPGACRPRPPSAAVRPPTQPTRPSCRVFYGDASSCWTSSSSNAFTVGRMSAAVREMKFKPGRIAELGLFNPESIDTTIAMFERKGDLLVLVPPTPRGGPGTTMEKEKRDLRAIPVPHFELDDAIYADEVQNVRAFGQEQALETVVAKVAQRQQTMVNSFAVTEEHARMGAVTGVVTYPDGSTLDLFNTFGVTQEAELNFDLANKDAGALRTFTQEVRRQVLDLLGGVGVTGLRAFCGDNFFDALIANAEVRATYLQTQAGGGTPRRLRHRGSKNIYGAFKFGDIVFENYRGSVGSTSSSTPIASTSSPKASRVCSARSTRRPTTRKRSTRWASASTRASGRWRTARAASSKCRRTRFRSASARRSC